MNDAVREFLHILFKRKRFVLITFLVVAVPIILFTLLRPPKPNFSSLNSRFCRVSCVDRFLPFGESVFRNPSSNPSGAFAPSSE